MTYQRQWLLAVATRRAYPTLEAGELLSPSDRRLSSKIADAVPFGVAGVLALALVYDLIRGK